MKIGLLSDAHGNVEAFRLALEVLAQCGADGFVFLGDAVGYLPGDAVVEEIRTRSMGAIQGNHEAMLLSGLVPEERERIYQLKQTASLMSKENRAFIESWPTSYSLAAPCGPLLMFHGSPIDPCFGYVYPDTDLSTLAVPPGATIFMANTHRPFVREQGDKLFVNIGSCGLPRDNGAYGSACIFDTGARNAKIIRFNIEKQSKRALERCADIAEAVREIFLRRETPFVGEVLRG